MNSDCCPDYFSHCEGLDGGHGGKGDPLAKKKTENNSGRFQFAEGAPEEKIFPADLECPHGVVDRDGGGRKTVFRKLTLERIFENIFSVLRKIN